jgi:predicted permease
LFEVFGTRPSSGRFFAPDEEAFGGPAAVIISERLWRQGLGADAGAVGRTLRIAERPHTIVGIMPSSFRYPSAEIDAWLPAQLPAAMETSRQLRFYRTVGRMRTGVTLARAREDLEAIQREQGRRFPETDAGWTVTVTGLKEDQNGESRRPLVLLFSAVIFLLLVACANVACLMLAEVSRRAREAAIRQALGASRGSVVWQIFLEGLVLSSIGAAGGLLVTWWAAPFVRSSTSEFAGTGSLKIDARVALFTAMLAIAATVLFAVTPAVHLSRRNIAGHLTRGGRTQTARGRSPRLLVAAQIAITLVLITGAGLLARSFVNMEQIALGFEPAQVLTFRVTGARGESPASVAQRQVLTLAAIRELSSVKQAAIAAPLPIETAFPVSEFRILGSTVVREDEVVFAELRTVSSDYFALLGIRLVAGNTCVMDPSPTSWKALVNQTFARRYFPNVDPIGHRVIASRVPRGLADIIGVTMDAREDGVVNEPQATVYICGTLPFSPDPRYLIRTSGIPADVMHEVRRVVHRVNPGRAVYAERPLDEVLATSLGRPRVSTTVMTLFAGFALLLAALGLYGVLSHWVSTARREIGLRLALGATPRRVLGEVVARAAIVVAVGLAIGLAASLALSRVIASVLFGIPPTDAVTFLAGPLILTIVMLAACALPARRAAGTDPTRILSE